MADSGAELLKGVMTRLLAYSALTTIVSTKVYSNVPQQTATPYVVVSVSSEPFDYKNATGMKHRILAQGFSEKASPKEALDIRAAVLGALDRQETNITLSGYNLVRLNFSSLADCFKEDDGTTWQSIVQFEAVVEG